MRLTLHHVPPSQGLRWMSQGWAVFVRAPMAFSTVLLLPMLVALLLTGVPVLGPWLVLVALPLVPLVAMLHSHQALQNRPMGWGLWAQALRLSPQRTRAHLGLGLLFTGGVVAVMFLSHWVDGGALLRLSDAMAELPEGEAFGPAMSALMDAAMQDPAWLRGSLFRTLALFLLGSLFAFAPALVHWGGQGALQALFSNVLGLWHNRGAMAMNALGWMGLQAALGLALGLVGAAVPPLLPILLPTVLLGLTTVYLASLYFMFVDTFRFTASPPPAAAPSPAA